MSSFPSECRIAVRDWSPVVDAISQGKQVILLRRSKPAHDCFVLLPTYTFANEKDYVSRHFRKEFHSFVEKNVADKETRSELADCFCRVQKCIEIGTDEIDKLRRIEEYYIWTADHVLKYFQGQPAFVWLLRAYKLARPQRISVPRGPVVYVHLDQPLHLTEETPILSDSVFAEIIEGIKTKLVSARPAADLEGRVRELETKVTELSLQLREKDKHIQEILSDREQREPIDDVIADLRFANEQDFLRLEWVVSKAFGELGFNSLWNGKEQDGRPSQVASKGYADVEVEAPLAGEPYFILVEATKVDDATSQATELSRTGLHFLKSTKHKAGATVFRLLVAPRFKPQVVELCQKFTERMNLIELSGLLRLLEIHQSIGGITQEEFRRLLELQERGLISMQVISEWEEAVTQERASLALLLEVYSVLFENAEWMTTDTIHFLLKKQRGLGVSEKDVEEAIGILKAPVINAVAERPDERKPRYKASMTPQTFHMRIRKLDESILRNRSKTGVGMPGKISSYTT